MRDSQIACGQDTDEAFALTDRQDTSLGDQHFLRCLEERALRTKDAEFGRDDLMHAYWATIS